MTDIIITLKMLVAATRSEIPPIARMNVVIVLRVEVMLDNWVLHPRSAQREFLHWC